MSEILSLQLESNILHLFWENVIRLPEMSALMASCHCQKNFHNLPGSRVNRPPMQEKPSLGRYLWSYCE